MADLHDLLKQKDVLRDLEGWRVGKARAELRRSIRVYQGNARELLVLLGEYRENHGTIATFDVTQPQGFERYLEETQRLLHNYLAAAESLRLHIVRIHKAHLPPLPDDADSAEYDSRERETFGNPLGRFGRDLRHHFLKEWIPMADGYLQWGKDPAYRKSDIRLDRTALLAERPGWSEPAKTYIDRCGDDISINEFVVEHRERISAFCKWFDEAVVRRNQRALQEFIDRTEAVDRAMRDAWGPPLEDPVGTPFATGGSPLESLPRPGGHFSRSSADGSASSSRCSRGREDLLFAGLDLLVPDRLALPLAKPPGDHASSWLIGAGDGQEPSPKSHLGIRQCSVYASGRLGRGSGLSPFGPTPRSFLSQSASVHRIVPPCLRAAANETEVPPPRSLVTAIHGSFVPAKQAKLGGQFAQRISASLDPSSPRR